MESGKRLQQARRVRKGRCLFDVLSLLCYIVRQTVFVEAGGRIRFNLVEEWNGYE